MIIEFPNGNQTFRLRLVALRARRAAQNSSYQSPSLIPRIGP